VRPSAPACSRPYRGLSLESGTQRGRTSTSKLSIVLGTPNAWRRQQAPPWNRQATREADQPSVRFAFRAARARKPDAADSFSHM
jgi:hypothetical protein